MGQRKIQQFARLRRCRMSIVLMRVPGAVRRHFRASAEHWETAFQIAAEHQDIRRSVRPGPEPVSRHLEWAT